MQPLVYDKTATGLPGTTLVADLSDRAGDIEYTRAAFWGDLTARVSWSGSLDEGFHAADSWLGNPIKLYSPDGIEQWSGLVWTVNFGAGRRRRSRSLEGYANRARVHYRMADFTTEPRTELGPAPPVVADDTAGQGLYGIIETQDSIGDYQTAAATSRAAELLSRHQRLLWLPETGTPGRDAGDAATIELECYGWWRTLFYRAYTATSTGTGDIKSVIQDILTTVCPFISTDYTQMAITGTSAPLQYDTYDLAGDLIKDLVGLASGYMFRLDGRVPILRASNRLSASVDYVEDLTGAVRTSGGAEVPLWEIKPDTILRQEDFAPPSLASAAAIDEIQNVYVTEVSWRSPGEVSYRAAVPGVLGEVSA